MGPTHCMHIRKLHTGALIVIKNTKTESQSLKLISKMHYLLFQIYQFQCLASGLTVTFFGPTSDETYFLLKTFLIFSKAKSTLPKRFYKTTTTITITLYEPQTTI